jgi:hypothetical protein
MFMVTIGRITTTKKEIPKSPKKTPKGTALSCMNMQQKIEELQQDLSSTSERRKEVVNSLTIDVDRINKRNICQFFNDMDRYINKCPDGDLHSIFQTRLLRIISTINPTEKLLSDIETLFCNNKIIRAAIGAQIKK